MPMNPDHARDCQRIWQVSRDMLGVADGAGVWCSINPAWLAALGWRDEDILGRTSDWLLHPDDVAAAQQQHARLLAGETISDVENRLRTSDGRYRIISWSIAPIDGRRYCVARDVTEERGREAALHDQTDFSRLALQAVSGVGVWTYEVASDCFFCDAGVAEVYGIDARQAAIGIKRADFLANVHPDDLAALRKTMSGGLQRAGDLELEYRIRHPDGSTRWVLSRGHTYFNGDHQPVRRTGVGIDMTKQRLLEQQLQQSQKMEVVGQLTGGLAHDFNNLLAGILGAMDLMTIRIAQGHTRELARYIGVAQGAARKAAALTHRLLAFSRRQTLDARHTDVGQLVAGMEELIRRTVGPAIVIETDAQAGLWPVLVDANQLENVLLNLCLNARDAMPQGGRIAIACRNLVVDGAAASDLELSEGDYLCLRVSDTGHGMTPAVVAQAFEPFFTTKPMGQGTGLGLSMIYGFMRQSGGHVRIESEAGRGTSMFIYLPRSAGEAEAPPFAAAPAAAPPRAAGGETVLVVDDEPMVRMVVVEVLHDLGYIALEAGNGAEAAALLDSNARIDLLITDFGLPGDMNGRQVAAFARRVRPGLNVLFITGYVENAELNHGVLGSGSALLTKPFSVGELAQRVEELLRR